MNNKLITHVAIHKYRHICREAGIQCHGWRAQILPCGLDSGYPCRNDEVVYNNMPITIDKHLSSNNALLHSTAAHQSGAVLIVSLIMLLLLTLIGVTGSQVTGLEEKMAGNSRDHNLAFQAAESALRAGEAATMGSPVFYTGSTQPINWANAAVTTYSGGTLTGIYQNPVYIIESLPNTTGAGGCPPCEGGTSESSTSISWYRITAHGWGGTPNALVTLQSIHRR